MWEEIKLGCEMTDEEMATLRKLFKPDAWTGTVKMSPETAEKLRKVLDRAAEMTAEREEHDS